MGSVSVSSCRCCMFESCAHPVAVLNAAFCMTWGNFINIYTPSKSRKGPSVGVILYLIFKYQVFQI